MAHLEPVYMEVVPGSVNHQTGKGHVGKSIQTYLSCALTLAFAVSKNFKLSTKFCSSFMVAEHRAINGVNISTIDQKNSKQDELQRQII